MPAGVEVAGEGRGLCRPVYRYENYDRCYFERCQFVFGMEC